MKSILFSLFALTSSVSATAANSIIGGWYFGPGYPSNNGIVITFFEDGTFYMAEDGVAEANGGPGMERGSYVFNANQHSLTTTVIDDTSGNWGLSHTFISRAELKGDTLTVKVAGEPLPFPFSRLDTQNPILGSWYSGPGSPHDNGVVISFLAHGNYFMAEDGIADDGGGPGMGRGDYQWDGENNITFNGGGLQGIPWRDTTGDWGLSHALVSHIQINGDVMTVSIDGEGERQLTRIQASPVFHALIPIPALSICLLFFTLAATTFLHQTRRRHCK